MKSEGWTPPGCRESAVAAEKEATRALMAERRGAISAECRRIMSETISAHVLSLPEVMSARLIDLYIPLPAHPEVNTWPLVEALTLLDKQLAVPVVQDQELCSALYRKGEPLRGARFGQPEPEVLVKADEAMLDVVLIPLLAFDRSGYRLGYGKGFYDRFLHRLSLEGFRPLRIGLAFSMQMIDTVPHDSWDEPLDGVVHEEGFIRFT